jgi:hypothetical protein
MDDRLDDRRTVRGALFGGALVAVAALSAAAVVVAAPAAEPSGLTREEYLAQVSEICERYGQQLDLIPAYDASAPGSIYETTGLVIPIVEGEIADVRSITPPPALERQVNRFVELSRRAALRRVRAEAFERDLWGSAQAFSRFEEVRNRAQVQGRRIGFRC